MFLKLKIIKDINLWGPSWPKNQEHSPFLGLVFELFFPQVLIQDHAWNVPWREIRIMVFVNSYGNA